MPLWKQSKSLEESQQNGLDAEPDGSQPVCSSHGRGSERMIQSQTMPDVMSPEDIIIAVMGITGSGKTTFISRCMGEDVGIGHGLHSFTQDVAIHSFLRGGRTIRLIDTPGFDDTAKTDVNILNNIAFWLSHAYRAEPKLLLSGIIYLHPISETRMTGTATKNLVMMKQLCGEENLGAVWLATTMWGLVSPQIGETRERQLISTDQFWGGFIRHGSKVYRHEDSAASAFTIIDQIIAHRQPVVLRIQQQMVDEYRDVDQTDAGKYLRRNVIQEQSRVRDRLARSAQVLEEKLKTQEAAEIEELLEKQREYHQRLEAQDKSLKAMKLDMEKLRKQKAQELAEREEEFVREKAAQDAKMAELDKQVRDLQARRDKAIKQAKADAERQRKLEDANLQLKLDRDRAAIASIDRAIEDRRREEEQVQHDKQQVVKQESIFKKTMKVSMAQSLVHAAFHIVSAGCTVM